MRHFGIDEANKLVPLLKQTFDEVRAAMERREPPEAISAKLQPLLDMGIEIKAVDGLVDFRALRNGRTVYLCWRYGEDEITHWHDLDTGFAGRRPIASRDEFAPTYLS